MEAGIRSGYADTPLRQVHYREAGAGPPVVLLHESPISGRIFDAVLPVLGRRVRAIAPDTPGYGASDPPPELVPIAGYAERLALFMEALGLERVALVGNHTKRIQWQKCGRNEFFGDFSPLLKAAWRGGGKEGVDPGDIRGCIIRGREKRDKGGRHGNRRGAGRYR